MVQVLAWRRTGDKPLPEPMIIQFNILCKPPLIRGIDTLKVAALQWLEYSEIHCCHSRLTKHWQSKINGNTLVMNDVLTGWYLKDIRAFYFDIRNFRMPQTTVACILFVNILTLDYKLFIAKRFNIHTSPEHFPPCRCFIMISYRYIYLYISQDYFINIVPTIWLPRC